jgi:hypothetical protein
MLVAGTCPTIAVSKLGMKQTILGIALAATLVFVSACSAPRTEKRLASSGQRLGQSPFLISVVPTQSFHEPLGRIIAMTKTSPGFFYVVLTNVSNDPQAAFETWNEWGYQAVSFEAQTADGHTIAISKKSKGFRANAPATFIIPPGEHMVYSISLDEEWDAVPMPPTMADADATPIKILIKAIYEVKPTPEAAEEKVWTGRLESKIYDFDLRHW